MVVCRCGKRFENHYGDAAVVCPRCHRTYLNLSPNLFHPETVEEMEWDCPVCKTHNPCALGGCITTKCIRCGAPKRPKG